MPRIDKTLNGAKRGLEAAMSKHGGEYFCGSVHDSDYESVDGFADEIYKLTFIPFGEDIPCV